MKNPGLSLLVLTISLFIPAYGQEPKHINKEIGLSFFTLEMNSETLNHEIEPKFVYGVYFNQYFSNLSWISHLEYDKNGIEDDCKTCLDTYYGKGKMTEFDISTGLRYTFLEQRTLFVKPFIESDLFFSNILYKGDFGGGFSGSGIKIDNSHSTFGILVRTGLIFYPISRISISISSSARFGTGTKINHYQDNSEKINSSALTVMHIRLGYQF